MERTHRKSEALSNSFAFGCPGFFLLHCVHERIRDFRSRVPSLPPLSFPVIPVRPPAPFFLAPVASGGTIVAVLGSHTKKPYFSAAHFPYARKGKKSREKTKGKKRDTQRKATIRLAPSSFLISFCLLFFLAALCFRDCFFCAQKIPSELVARAQHHLS